MMKSIGKVKHKSDNKDLKVESKAKIYVPIQASNVVHRQQIPEPKQTTHVFDHQAMNQLRRANIQLREKQEIYIDKLIKLEEGLEKQHAEFMQLQDLYNELFTSYKCKEEEIAELEQKYRESNRKKESLSQQANSSLQVSNQTQLKRQVADMKDTIEKLQAKIAQYTKKIQQLQKTVDKLYSQTVYLKNKQKMNDSRASLNSKVFEQLEEWQRMADSQKQQKIKLQYENKFLRSRNDDLETRVTELQQYVSQKQSQVMKLRQSNIFLSRQNSENRLNRSASRSPFKQDDKQNSDRKPESALKTSKIIGDLHQQNKELKKKLQALQQKLNTTHSYNVRSPRNQLYIKQQQFFSFSREDNSNHPSNHSSNQQNNRLMNKEYVKIENDYQINKSTFETDRTTEREQSSRRAQTKIIQENTENQSLQELPPQLQIEKLIMNSKKKQQIDFLQ